MRSLIKEILLLCLISTIIASCEKDSFVQHDENTNNSHSISIESAIPNLISYKDVFEQTELTHVDQLIINDLKVFSRVVDGKNLNNLTFNTEQSSKVIYGLIYYTKDDILNGIGVHYFSSERKNNLFDLYKIDTKGFDKVISLIANELAFSEISYLSVNTFDNSDIDMTFPREIEREKTNNNFSDLRLKVELDYIKNKYTKSKKVSKALNSTSYQGCGYVGNCKTTIGNVCRPGLYHCQQGGGICPMDAALDYSEENASSADHNDFINSGDRENFHRFRDEFLYNSTAGTEYSETFYSISEQFVDALDLIVLGKIVDVMPNINDAVENLFDTTYTGHIIDSQLRDDIFDITTDLKANSISSIFISEVEQFEIDINTLSLKNRNDIDYEMDNF